MQTMKLSRSDGRIDGLSHKVDEVNREMHAEFRAVRSEMQSEFQAVHGRFDALQRSMLTVMGTMVVGLASILATQL